MATMDLERPPSHQDIPSLVESLSSDQVSEFTHTEESFEIDDWSSLSPTIETREHYNTTDYHFQPYQHQHQFYQNHHHQQHYQQHYQQQPPLAYPQYGYMTPQYSSTPPYAGAYYIPSPPVDYQNGYSQFHYENQQQQQQQPQRIINTGTPSPSTDAFGCDICQKSFKSAANLNRHFMSKTHMKRVNSRKLQATRSKKQKLGSALTDLSEDEKRFLWQLDDEIWRFLSERDAVQGKSEILPTPPLSPSQRKREQERLRAAIEEEDERQQEIDKSEES